jgi:VCBS repeat-containing protein
MAIQATQTSGQVIGFVRQVIGEVKATSSDGVTRTLQVGDLVFADDLIVTGELGSIEIVFNDGGNLTLGRNSQGLLDADVYQTTTPEDGSEYAASIDAIQQAILMGEDPTAIQEAPAAGEGETATGNEGTSFVSVARTGAETTPESGFETEGLTISFADSEESASITNLLPTIDLDGDDNSIAGDGYQSQFIENGGPLPIADSDIQVSNPDGTVLESARIVLTNAQDGDQLDVSAITGLTVEVDSSVPGVISVLLSGVATPQAYAEAIRNIGFINTTDNPDETPRVIEVTVNDGEFDSNTATTTITVQAVNDAPVVDLDNNDTSDSGYDYLTSFTEGDAAISIADIDMSVTDVDNESLQSATVILTNPQSDDILALGEMPEGLIAVVDGYTISISGEASLADYHSAINAITFENTSQNPSSETRLIQVRVNDGELDSEIAVTRIEVHGVNDIAEIDLDADDSSASGSGYETTFVEDGGAVSIVDEDVTIADLDDENIESATIVLTNHQTFDHLIVRDLPNGITATADDLSVTLTGTASLADYEQALQAIHFVNTSDFPQTFDRIINITLNDGDGNSDTAVSTIHIVPVNDAPDADNDLVSTQENTPVGIYVLGNDSDPEGDRLSVTSNTQPANGTLVQNSNGSYQYTPNPGFTGTDSFTYTVTDGNDGYDTATVMISVAGTNDGPAAVNDSANTSENTAVTIDVLTNDTDPEGDVLSISSFTQGVNGAVVIDPVSGNPVYTPNPGFTGSDTFTYTVSDSNGGTATATVTVTVGGVNDAPVAADDTVGTNQDIPVIIDVLPNDSDPDGDTLTVTSVTQGANGSVTIDPVSGNPVYTPNPGFYGSDSFTYTVDDGNGGTDTATVTVTVNPVNDLPEIAPATAVVSEEGLISGVPDSSGSPTDTSDSLNDIGSMSIFDADEDTLTVTLTEPGFAMTSNGEPITWTGDGTDTLIGSAGSSEVIRISIDQAGDYSVTLSGQVDHPVVGQEDVISFDVDVTVDDGTDSVSAPLTIQIEDDAPSVNTVTANMHIGVDSLSIGNLAAGWTNPVFINGTRYVTQEDTDTDSFVDNLMWGRVPRGGSQSGYTLVDNSDYSGSGQSVQIGESFKLADFSHNNFPIYSGYSSLDQVTLTIEMDVVVNGIPTTVQFDVLMDHNETPNSGADPRDIITLPAQAVTISIGGQEYEVRVDGFMDTNGQIVSTILTDENAVNPFEIMGSIVSTDPLPVVAGSVANSTGGDGSSTNVVWGDTSSPYGDLTVNANGNYSFQLNRETKDGLDPGETITETFSYSITDEDGDTSSATLTITIGGYQSIDGSPVADILTGGTSNEYLAGYEGNDTLNGNAGDDVLDGGSGSDQVSGGSGNDTLIFDSSDSLLSGDAGFDTLIAPDNDDLDFSGISNISNIERIDLRVGNHDILNLSVDDVLTMTDNDNLLEILGDHSDSVQLSSDWHESGNQVTQNGHTFTEYLNGDDSVTLLIEDQVNVTIV